MSFTEDNFVFQVAMNYAQALHQYVKQLEAKLQLAVNSQTVMQNYINELQPQVSELNENVVKKDKIIEFLKMELSHAKV